MKEKKHLSILLPATVICILAVTIYFQMTNGTISVSNTVNGKELPIYCVDTQEPKISISFDVCITYADSIIPNKIDIAKKISDL